MLSRALPGSAMAFQNPGEPGRQQSPQRAQPSTTAPDPASIGGRILAGTYLMAATPEVDEGEWYEPSFLEGLKAGSAQLAISDGDAKTVTIRVTSGGTHPDW